MHRPTPVRHSLALVVAASLLSSCGSEVSFSNNLGRDTWTQRDVNKVDLLFVVDDSASMQEEQEALRDGFADFVEGLSSSRVDFHLGVISTSMDDPSRAGHLLGTPAYLTADDDYVALFKERVLIGTTGSDKEKGLEAALTAFTPANLAGANEGFLRRDAYLLTVFVTDEEDCSDFGALDAFDSDACYQQPESLVPIDEVLEDFQSLKDDPELVQVAAIMGLPWSECEEAWPSERYRELAIDTAGYMGDICKRRWGNMLYELGLNAGGMRSEFRLTGRAVPSSIEMLVDGVSVPSQGNWTYEEENTTVFFKEKAIPPRGSVITAEYTVQPGASDG